MDITSLNALLGALPQAGVGGIALGLLWLLFRREATSQDRFTAEYERVNSAHDAELRELREQIKGLRDQMDELQRKLDLERQERRKAEDEAAAYRRGIKGPP